MNQTVMIALILLLLLPTTACTALQTQSQIAPAETTASKPAPAEITPAEITPETLAIQMTQSAPLLILDVRSIREYEAGHIPGAINIEYREVQSRLDQLQAFKGRHVVLYCERGVRARRAEAALLSAGFDSLSQLQGHMPAWKAAGFPVEVGNSE